MHRRFARKCCLCGVIVRSLEQAEPFTTADGSTIRELLGLPTAPSATRASPRRPSSPARRPNATTTRESEEIYYLVEGSGEMELDGERRTVSVGDAC